MKKAARVNKEQSSASTVSSAMGLSGLSGAMLAQAAPESGIKVDSISALDQME